MTALKALSRIAVRPMSIRDLRPRARAMLDDT